jgi:hypothetical protein
MKIGEYNRHLKNGWTKRFCSRSCSITYTKEHGKEIASNFGTEWNDSEANKTQIRKANKIRWERDYSGGFAEFLRRARKSVRSKGLDLSLTINDLKDQWAIQHGCCPYTGWQLDMPKSTAKKKPNTASLDRIDSSLGYIKGNVQFVSVMANFAKSDFDEKDMQNFCQAIKNHSGSPK